MVVQEDGFKVVVDLDSAKAMEAKAAEATTFLTCIMYYLVMEYYLLLSGYTYLLVLVL